MTDTDPYDAMLAGVRKDLDRVKDPLVVKGLRPGDHPKYVAWTLPPPWDIWAYGYKIAGDKLVDSLGGGLKADFVVYPVVNLYRHAVELKLKSLSLDATTFTDVSIEDRIRMLKGHRLLQLWKETQAVLNTAEFEISRDDSISHLTRRIGELDNLSPSGEEPRYPTDKSGKSFWVETDYLNLLQMRETMTGIWSILDGIESMIEHHKEIYRDMDYYR